jgi:hypothetical protein
MKLNPKLTGGLAWAGLIVILAVPSADMLTKPQGDAANRITADVDPIRTAAIAPRPSAAANRPATIGNTDDPVEDYIATGKKLPSYISDAPAEVAAAKPATTVRLVVPTAPTAADQPAATEVASIEAAQPATVAPQPYPASLRPAAPLTTASVRTDDDAPLILDEALVSRREAAVARVLDEQPTRIVTRNELEEWDSGSLAEYLERRGLMSEAETRASNSEFDEDGFFLDEGPNNSDGRRVIRRLPRNNDFFFF